MPSRRHLLATLAAGPLLGGCLATSDPVAEAPENPQSTKPASTGDGDDDTTETTATDGAVTVESIEVADFFQYPLSGTHPHVYNAPDRQFVVVRVATRRDRAELLEDLTVSLDGDELGLANRQPVPWSTETVDVAFRVSKDRSATAGSVAYRDDAVHALPDAAIERLNAPPRFSVVEPTLDNPDEIEAGGTLNATVSFDVRNEGAGDGTFGASLSGNYTSGSRTLTAAVAAGETATVSETVRIRGSGDEARVVLDWGVETVRFSVPVVGETTAE